MVHLILKYPDVITNLNFIDICTLPLEFRAGTAKQDKNIFLRRDGTENNVRNAIDDSAETDSFISARTRERMDRLATWRLHTVSERLTFQSVSECSLNVDKVSQF